MMVLMTCKKMMMGLKIIKRVQETYGRDGNTYLREKINLIFVSLRIMKKMQNAYRKNSNGHLRDKINLFTNKK